MARVLVIGDTHCPAMHPRYVAHLKKVERDYKCNRVVHIGDLVDWASISYHPKAPSLKNSEEEFAKAKRQVRQLYKNFRNCTWLIGNHDSLTERKAADLDLPVEVLKEYSHLWGCYDWKVIPRYGQHIIDGVIYQHGDRGRGGQNNAAHLNAQEEHASVVQGHHHAQMVTQYLTNTTHRIFGMQVGSGVDYQLEAMSYGKKYNKKPNLGCGVVIDGHTAFNIPMKN